jgi:hypothetical protein
MEILPHVMEFCLTVGGMAAKVADVVWICLCKSLYIST